MKSISCKAAGWLIVLVVLFASFKANAQTQSSMSAQAAASYQKADNELNAVYQKILKQYAANPAFIKNLKTAQRLWVQLRNADLAARYPKTTGSGSAEIMCKEAFLEDFTKERIKFLQVWLDGVEEGDVCAGSVKVKP